MQHNIKHTQGTSALHQPIKFRLHIIHSQRQALNSLSRTSPGDMTLFMAVS